MSDTPASRSTASTQSSEQPLVPIREVARQTGVNPVTLRAWERRYGLIQPYRSAKGHRLYSQAHIAVIQQVLSWLKRGVAVSQVKGLLSETTAAPCAKDSPWAEQQQQWFSWIEQLAERKLDTGFKQAMALYPPETLCQHLLLPLLAKLQQHGAAADGPRVEQVFFATWLRTQLAARIAQNNRLHSSPPLLIASLSEHRLQPELWLCGWLASYSACPVQVLEWPLPTPDLVLAVQRMQPRALLLYSDQRLAIESLQKLGTDLQCPLLLAGQAVRIHQAELLDYPQLNCANDPLQAFHSLLKLNLLQSR